MLVIEQTKGHSLTDWSQINWAGVERIVKRLQGRIFRAVRAGKLAKAKSLQKLLARSSSAKLLAIRKVSQENRGKHTPGTEVKSHHSRMGELLSAWRIERGLLFCGSQNICNALVLG